MEGVETETEKPFKKPPFERRASITSPHRIPVSFGENKKTVFTSGRPPWYSKEGQVVEPFMIGCAGGTASGKTTVAKKIIERLGVQWVVVLSMDSFYKNLTPEQLIRAKNNDYDFDSPDAFDFELLIKTLKEIKKGKQVELPQYDFSTHQRSKEIQIVYGANVVVFEGIFALYSEEVSKLMDLKIFVATDDDVRLARRLKRDIAERGRDIKGVLSQYNRFVRPAYEKYIKPTIHTADVIIPRGGDNIVAIDLIGKHIRRKLEERGFNFRQELASTPTDEIPSNVTILRPTRQLKMLHTIIRDRTTSRDDFIFYSQRLFRIIIEEALSHFEFVHTTVETPTTSKYLGRERMDDVCGVSIVRAGVTLENAFHHIQKDVRIGKILIQTDVESGEPQLHYCSLPRNIQDNKVLLMDATIATGAAGLMAIRILLDHGVPQEKIVFISLIATPQGLHSIAYAFPKVKIVVTEVDKGLNDLFHIIPGIGNFGDRFYGTDNSKYENIANKKRKPNE